ncbi:MAG: YdiU family protein [Bdellovibrionaceae bacterium]|nr:YdiU family protein [Pseudobdellovibrionaceae bacterium]
MNTNYRPSTAWESLGAEFHDPVAAATFPKAILRYRNEDASRTVGLEDLSPEQWKSHFHGFSPLPQSLQKPLALRYHGHQFMHYNPDIGDGRGFLFAQLLETPKKPTYPSRLLDLGTKGSGQTPWSRRGDGRLTLKGAVRELLATSYLQAHGVNTSKTFSIFETGENLERGDEPSPTRSAVLTRLSHGHVRIGMFQRWATLQKKEEMQKLLEYCVEHHYPEVIESETPVQDFFEAVCRQVASTTAQWMAAGFVHGVLNSDNINVTGESFDYGPYRFLPHYDDSFTAAYFDHNGLYAYGEQPRVMMWNLEQLENSLYLLEPNKKMYDKGYSIFEKTFNQRTFDFFVRRLGLVPTLQREPQENLTVLALQFLRSSKVPFEHFFFDWFGGQTREEQALSSERASFYEGQDFENFLNALSGFKANTELLQSPYWQRTGPVELYIDTIEKLWSFIDKNDDWQPLYEHIKDMSNIPNTLSFNELTNAH